VRQSTRSQLFAFGVPGVDDEVMRALAGDKGYFKLAELYHKQQLNNDTQTKTGEKPPATGGKPDDKKATEPPAGSAQPAIAPNKSTNDR